jgi:transposase
VAGIGVNMNQFPTAQQRASWAAICPGNHESAGKRKSGKTRDGNKWLRRTLCQAAWAVSRKKNRCRSSQFKRDKRTCIPRIGQNSLNRQFRDELRLALSSCHL